MTDLTNLSFAQLRDLAKKNNINSYGKGRDDLIGLLADANVAPEEKRGKPTWKPANMLDLKGKKAGFRYRFCDADPAKLRRREDEGWVYVTRETGHGEVSHADPELVHGGSPPDGTVSYRDMVVMALPEEIAQQRDEYYKSINDAALQQVYDQGKEKLAGVGAPVHEGSGITRIK